MDVSTAGAELRLGRVSTGRDVAAGRAGDDRLTAVLVDFDATTARLRVERTIQTLGLDVTTDGPRGDLHQPGRHRDLQRRHVAVLRLSRVGGNDGVGAAAQGIPGPVAPLGKRLDRRDSSRLSVGLATRLLRGSSGPGARFRSRLPGLRPGRGLGSFDCWRALVRTGRSSRLVGFVGAAVCFGSCCSRLSRDHQAAAGALHQQPTGQRNRYLSVFSSQRLPAGRQALLTTPTPPRRIPPDARTDRLGHSRHDLTDRLVEVFHCLFGEDTANVGLDLCHKVFSERALSRRRRRWCPFVSECFEQAHALVYGDLPFPNQLQYPHPLSRHCSTPSLPACRSSPKNIE